MPTTYAITYFDKFPYFTWEKYKEQFGVPPPFNPELPLQFWYDPSCSLNSYKSRNYTVISMTDQKIPPYLVPTAMPEFMAARVNIPPQEWQVTSGKNSFTVPCPQKEEFVAEVEAGKYTFAWNFGIALIYLTASLVEPSVPSEFTQGDRQLITSTESMVKEILAIMQSMKD